MIDLAGPMKGLGNVDGPTLTEVEGEGAVPDSLLDAQDDLDLQTTQMGKDVIWLQQLEVQCTR
jgi:hypothetical protein